MNCGKDVMFVEWNLHENSCEGGPSNCIPTPSVNPVNDGQSDIMDESIDVEETKQSSSISNTGKF